MAKYMIKIATAEHGAISVLHNGKDQQYCDNGVLVKVRCQPDAGWGLQEVHYEDANGNKTPISDNSFTMPSKNVTVVGTFKRFVIDDWDGSLTFKDNDATFKNNVNVTKDINARNIEAQIIQANTVSSKGDISAVGKITAKEAVIGDGKPGMASYITLYDSDGVGWNISITTSGVLDIRH